MTTEQDLQPLFDLVKQSVFDGLPDQLRYHNTEHTRTVMRNVLILGNKMGFNNGDMRMLYAAAILHDTGYGKKYSANEGVAAMLASKLLPDFGFSQEEVEAIKSMILATNLVITPSNRLEMCLADADMAYIAQSDFLEWSNRLRLEWIDKGNFKGSNADWIQLQIDFLSNYAFLTEEATKLFGPGKEENIERLKGLSEWPF